MNWYKIAKDLKDIALDPTEESSKDNWESVHMDSDLNAIMMRMYRLHIHPEGLEESDVQRALSDLKGDDEDGMWRTLSIKKPDYIEELVRKAEKKYPNFYEKTKKAEEGVVPLPDPQQQGAPGGDMGGGLGF